MAATKFALITAVPFHVARLQNNVNRTVVRKTSEVGFLQTVECDDSQNRRRKRRRLDHLTLQEKVKLRKQANREASQISRERAKFYQTELEKQLLDVQIERMKLLLENEKLKNHHNNLEQENLLLKERLQRHHSEGENDQDDKLISTFKHAEEMGSSSTFNHPTYNTKGFHEDEPPISKLHTYVGSSMESQNFTEFSSNSVTSDLENDIFPSELSKDFDIIQWILNENICVNDENSCNLDPISKLESIPYASLDDTKTADETDHFVLPEMWDFSDLYDDDANESSFYT